MVLVCALLHEKKVCAPKGNLQGSMGDPQETCQEAPSRSQAANVCLFKVLAEAPAVGQGEEPGHGQHGRFSIAG